MPSAAGWKTRWGGEIQEKLSPGQMVDELLNYAKDSGGSEFVADLGQSVRTNPLPVALLGMSLMWLIASPVLPTASNRPGRQVDRNRRQRVVADRLGAGIVAAPDQPGNG